jgi:hypothetical protein
MFVISIKTKPLAHYFHDLSLFIFTLKCIFAVARCVIVVREMFAEVYNCKGMGNKLGFAKFLLVAVAMRELNVAQSQLRAEFFLWCCQGGPSL